VTAFATVWRTFLDQFFSSEVVTSDLRLRQGIIWVMAFLVAPGISIATRFGAHYQLARVWAPERADGLLLMVITLFVSYSCVATALIAVFVWDALSFTRRDAMVLGVMPLPGSTIVLAKLAALAAFLGGAHVGINLTTGFLFSVGVAGTVGGVPILHQLLVHFLVTGLAALFVFATLITVRGLLGLLSARLAAAAAAVLQFTFVAGMLCFLLYSLISARTIAVPAAEVRWVPSFWFVGLYEVLLGVEHPAYGSLSGLALWAVAGATLSALAATLASLPIQFRGALTPSPSPSAIGGSARLLRGVAWLAGAHRPLARAVSDFVLVTLVRNRSVQVLVAVNAALVAPIVALGFYRAGSFEALARDPQPVLWIPLVAVYCVAIGLRAAFYVPSELPASWTFAVNAPGLSREYRAGVRAALLAVLWFTGVAVAALSGPALGWPVAIYHALFVLVLSTIAAEVVLMTVAHVPFTQPYPPGHARLRTRWWIYVAGFLAFAYAPVRIELFAIRGRIFWSDLFIWIALPMVVTFAASRWLARPWRLEVPDETDADESTVIRLGLAPTTQVIRTTIGPAA
jgi:hypothetical protein